MKHAVISLAAVIGSLLLPANGAWAQQSPPPSPTAPQGVSNALPLAIPALPGAKMIMEVDARDSDLLGMVKNLLAGLEGSPAPAKPAIKTPAKKISAVKGKGVPSPAAPKMLKAQPPPAQTGGDSAFKINGMPINLTELLKNIKHLRVVTYRADDSSVPNPITNSSGDALAFYESAFVGKEGGRRVFWSDNGGDGARIALISFDRPQKHFALVWQEGPRVTVVRADGYPNMNALTSALTMFAGNK